MFKKVLLVFILFFVIVGVIFVMARKTKIIPQQISNVINNLPFNSLQISYLRSKSYTGSNIIIEQTLTPGSNYKRYIASYYSEENKIYGLLTIPNGEIPNGGFPAIIFNHGYITPEKYTPDGNYVAYVDALTRAGYVVFKPDYRGNGKSGGKATSAYFSSDYDIDDLNAIASVEKYKNVNPNKIGVWGHSMGGHITLVDLVVSNNIKAAVIWGGVVGSYNDIIYNWQNRVSYQPDAEDLRLRNLTRQDYLNKYGSPSANPDFWKSIDPTENLDLVNAPVQINVGAADNQVPPDFSEGLYSKLKNANKTVEFYSYPGANHDIAEPSFNLAMERTITFFDKYLK